ncbi:vanillate O-demethylase monooxygenase subunit [Novosphingobium sp. PhB57]|jgi:vanillate O-demethylase monooxygenase subunit|uniref:aromatic ring-hydroxylating dioxygenase subunit alpha n=1 Tax=unclassified Novosphingobium TaxID=2644732 RepID=UPI001049D33C|nr:MULTISPECIES: aromatic ring-hydroxylating dioxygenase subunit alpha [unclassified Novosphingobium]TCU58517.1 vanillate O-demethylase monooxygenase subunit [Novosphingobium sp. PhB57]TDW61502.1 vanillate O-demethylase monooxygenase subunit [Novosphingobium sp. PhB55]
MFIRNTWYVAAFAAEIEPGKTLARRFLNEPVVLFRTSDGQIAALEDRCSHRAMPLSAGHVEGDVIRCCYHGVEFNRLGACTRIPNQTRIPPSANVRHYPVLEKDHLIWIWMGDEALADPSTVIDSPEHNDPAWTWRPYNFHVKADWQLIIDNIMDLTHVPYIHARTIGGNPEQHYGADTKVEFDGNKVTLLRKMPNSVPPRSYIDAGGFKGRVDRWQEVRFEPRVGMTCRVNAGGCDVGTGAYEGKRDNGFMLANNHFITPETDRTSHYLWTICTTASKESGVPEVLFDQFFDTITEDEETLQAQQLRIDDAPHRGFVGIASDGAVNQARRVLSNLFEAEQGELVAAE